MPKNKNNRKRSSNKQKGRQQRIPAQQQAYFGPLTPQPSQLKRRSFQQVFLRLESTITSSAGGVISPIYTSADPRTLATDFSSFAAVYSEYRVVGLHILFMPLVSGAVNNVLIFGLPASTAIQTGSLSAASAYTDLIGADSLMKWSLNRSFNCGARAAGSDEMGFTPVGSDPATASTFSIKTYASGYAASTNYGTILVTYTIQFQNRQ